MRRSMAVLAILLAGVLVALGANLAVGSVSLDAGQVLDALARGSDGSLQGQVIWQIRLPRAVAALVLGAGLAVAGYLLQTLFDNPLAGPYVLGISSGSKLAIAAVMVGVLGTGQSMTSWTMVGAAFVGALMAMAAVMAIARHVSSGAMLVVAGVMVGYLCSAGTDFLVTFADERSIANLHTWALGSFSGIAWDDVAVLVPVTCAGCLGAFLLAKPIGALLMGEAYAQSVGVDVKALRLALVGIASLLAACVTAFAGPVSFVGIAVPIMSKWLLGSARPLVVVPACMVGGAIFCLVCDLIARTAFAPVELTLSAVTAVFGVPVVLAMLLRRGGGR